VTRVAALVVRGRFPLRFAGLDLAERAEKLLLRRAGIEHVQIVDDTHPFAHAPAAEVLVVLPERLIVEPGAITDALRRGLHEEEDAVVVVDDKGRNTGLMMLSAPFVERIRALPRLESSILQGDVPGVVRASLLAPRFVARIRDSRDVAPLEARYLRHMNGGDGEGVFTRNIRFFSIPVSRRLLRLSVSANQVTVAGFALALLAGLSFSFGTYWAGIAGAILYWASMVLDCSDGEVARATLSDSSFGAWLETATDYASYLAVIGGIVWADFSRHGFHHHIVEAIVASVASIAIMAIVTYLRARVARLNPGAFDDALAAELGRGSRIDRFAVVGRQLIKRSFLAHLILFQALIGHLPALLEIWAYGSIAGLLIVIAVQTQIIRTVRVQPHRQAITP
jgi:phosphatidylglycerophosphate synthase